MNERVLEFILRRIPLAITIFLLIYIPILGERLSGKDPSEFYLIAGVFVTNLIVLLAGNWGVSLTSIRMDQNPEPDRVEMKFYKTHSFWVSILYTIWAGMMTYEKYKMYFI